MNEPNFKIKTEGEQNGYGRFTIEPLEQGYGQTLGNSLRRVLLSSLPGYAITSVKIEGAKHQFTTIPGMKEDVVEFLLNLKKIRLNVEGSDSATLTISANGPGTVTAGDIECPAGVSIVNKDLVLCTLSDKKSNLEAELSVEKGYGYVPTDDKHIEEIGRIPLDALYSPVLRVNYKVEATRVGRMTNLDRLVLDIWTDGSVPPGSALKAAAKILSSYFRQIYEPRVGEMEEEKPMKAEVPDELLKTRIEELDIPTRIVNALSNGGVETIGQLIRTPRSEVIKIKNLGAKSLAIVEDRLREKGVTLNV